MKTITVSSVTVAGSNVTIAGTIADKTFSQPFAQMTIGEVSPVNPNWSRYARINDQCLQVGRNGANTAAIDLESLIKIAVTLEPSLTFAPWVTTQPANQSTTATNPATFTAAGVSELTLTWGWQESADGATWSDLASGGIYDLSTPGSLVITPTDTSKTGYYYRAKLSNANGVSYSAAAKLTVS